MLEVTCSIGPDYLVSVTIIQPDWLARQHSGFCRLLCIGPRRLQKVLLLSAECISSRDIGSVVKLPSPNCLYTFISTELSCIHDGGAALLP